MAEKPYRPYSKIKKNTIVMLIVVAVLTLGHGLIMLAQYLMAWYPGQEGGRAIAEILSGKISPSGKLPISIGT